ncbi:MAG: deoxyribodipyrimidine photo-lyase [Arenicellales bacterium]|nr:deoxyribodipyrimidine photo-lyase [Arenicellales bacterium]
MAESRPFIVWFRQDLRLDDNPALNAAAGSGAPLLAVYILDDESAGEWAMGAASRWWLHESLKALDEDLHGGLQLFRGKATEIIPSLTKRVNAIGVCWNRCYEPWRITQDKKIESELQANGHQVQTFNGALLFEPNTITKSDGTPYKVFTPFYRKGCLIGGPPPRELLDKPSNFQLFNMTKETTLADLGLLPRVNWYNEMAEIWSPGEKGAQRRLQRFLDTGIQNYKSGRNRPDQPFVSRLSPHLHFGEISPHQVWYAAKMLGAGDPSIADDVDHFLSELGWREFSNNLLYYWPELPRENIQSKFDRFPWRNDKEALTSWQQGRTGYPIVDAGMRELWRTGYMHNRVRMIVGSFLVKNLLLHWHHGEEWFWDTLVDADLANNSASWQWVAGCGADAAPYFRIFNPITQAKKFDPDGAYVRQYVPELADLPVESIHTPWCAPTDILRGAGVRLGNDYPTPIVDLKESRERALAAFKSLSSNN